VPKKPDEFEISCIKKMSIKILRIFLKVKMKRFYGCFMGSKKSLPLGPEALWGAEGTFLGCDFQVFPF
jgi:hypothetical protein